MPATALLKTPFGTLRTRTGTLKTKTSIETPQGYSDIYSDFYEEENLTFRATSNTIETGDKNATN